MKGIWAALGLLAAAVGIGAAISKQPASGSADTYAQTPTDPTASIPENNMNDYNAPSVPPNAPETPYSPGDKTDYDQTRENQNRADQENLNMLINEGVLPPNSLAARQQQWAIVKDAFWFALLRQYGIWDNVISPYEQDAYNSAYAQLDEWMKAHPRPFV